MNPSGSRCATDCVRRPIPYFRVSLIGLRALVVCGLTWAESRGITRDGVTSGDLLVLVLTREVGPRGGVTPLPALGCAAHGATRTPLPVAAAALAFQGSPADRSPGAGVCSRVPGDAVAAHAARPVDVRDGTRHTALAIASADVRPATPAVPATRATARARALLGL